MKVALIIDSWFPAVGGGQINAWEISRRLASSQIQIDIITRNLGKDDLEKPANIKVYKLGPKTRPDSISSKIYFIALLLKFMIKHDYDLIHVHPFLPALSAKFISVVKKVPIIITVHGTRLFEKQAKTPSRILEKYILTQIKYDAQISVTHAFKKIPNVNKKIVVIPNSIDVARFTSIKLTKFTNPTILWVGRFDPVKRVEDLIFATRIISKKIKDLKLILVGYGYQKNNLQKLVNDLNLKNVVFEINHTEKELINLYKKSHVFVLPSASEGQPITILEAQAAALPVVATNVGGIPELIKNGQNGILVPPTDVKKLSEAILEVLVAKNNYGQKGFENAKKFSSWSQVSQMTKEVYQKVSR